MSVADLLSRTTIISSLPNGRFKPAWRNVPAVGVFRVLDNALDFEMTQSVEKLRYALPILMQEFRRQLPESSPRQVRYVSQQIFKVG
jgi:hypothetical protein